MRSLIWQVGHSLGSVICLDLLTHGGSTFQGIAFPPLSFRVTHFFALGSPAACFLIARCAGVTAGTARAMESATVVT